METALEVLSMAASMVETNDKNAQDPLYKGLPLVPPPPPGPPPTRVDLDPHRAGEAAPVNHVDARASPGKELPTKQLKHERLKERLELATSRSFDKEHAHQHQQRQATPTQGCRSSPEHYRNGDSSSVDSSSFPSMHHQLLSSRGGSLRTPPSHPPPRYQTHIDLHGHHEGPLNLTTNSNNNNNNNNNSSSNGGGSSNSSTTSGCHSPTQSRPSVITCANPLTTGGGSKYETSSNGSASPSRKETTDVCDPDIEEHFRRSLGSNYSSFMAAKPPSVTPSPPPAAPVPHTAAPAPPTQLPSPAIPAPPLPASPQERERERSSPRVTVSTSPVSKANTNVSITGSVDDHFARALGDSTWSALKAKSDPQEAPEPGSVDDHFAKALGDTWLRIKAERESPRGPPPPFPLPPYPGTHQLPHSIPHPHPHSLAHPLPPRPSSPSTQAHSTSLLST